MSNDGDLVGELQRRTRGLRVALVHDWLNGMRGGERVFAQFCRLFPNADVFTLFYEPEKVSPVIREMKVRESPLAARFPVSRRHYRKLLPLMPRMIEAFPTADYDLVISTSHCVAKGCRPPRRGLNLSYVFTPMRYVWDHFEDYRTGKFAPDAALRLVRGRLQRWDVETAQQIDSIVADSRHIAGKVREFWGRDSAVIYPPVDVSFFRPGEDYSAAEDYFLVVSALVPYKHVERAVEASRIARQPLVVIGDGPERERLRRMGHPFVRFEGWCSDQNLRRAYRRCKALLYPGVEDFGITSLEAQACGRPVLALRRGGATETVVEGITGAFFDEESAESLAQLMIEFDRMSFDPAAIRRHAAQFAPGKFREAAARWIFEEGRIRCW